MMRNIKEIVKRTLPDKFYLKFAYRHIMKRRLNLKNPQYYTEKLQWLKLYDHNYKYINLVDKYMVKFYIENILGEQYIIPTLKVWNDTNEIDFNDLPEQFVIKCTHDSGGVVIVSNKNELNIESIKNVIAKRIKHNYFYNAREWPYKYVKPRIIVEKFLDESGNQKLSVLNDYKFFCFNGKIDCVMVCLERHQRKKPIYVFYNEKWERLYYQKYEPILDKEIVKPINFEEMLEIVKCLSRDFISVRVDLYNVNGKIYFGEYTFFSQGGYDLDITEETDRYWGTLMKLPLENK